MNDFAPFELKQLEELNKALFAASGITQEQLEARISGMSMEQVIEDAMQYGIAVSKHTSPGQNKK